MSQETQAARWIGFRQPILRVALEKQGKKFNTTYEAHEAAGIGQVWEEDEFWIELSWRVDPDGSLGIRKHFESPYEPGKKMTVDDYYRWIFENSVPGLPEAAAKEGLKPLEYMRKYGAFLIEDNVYKVHETGIKSSDLHRCGDRSEQQFDSRKTAMRSASRSTAKPASAFPRRRASSSFFPRR